MRTRMEHVSIKLPTQLLELIDQKAENRGLDRSKTIRNDLNQIYFED